MAQTVAQYLAKHPQSPLATALPATYTFELSYANELDELWADELYELSQALENEPERWWILKPGMADKAQGIRLFRTRAELEDILARFEAEDDVSDEEEDEAEGGTDTVVSLSRMRFRLMLHPVRALMRKQEYIHNPLLLRLKGSPDRKFHLRVYVLAVGALRCAVAQSYDYFLTLL